MKSRLFPLLLAGLLVFLGLTPEAFSQDIVPQGADAAAKPSLLSTLINMAPMLLMCYAVFYLFVVRPQDKRAKAHKSLMDSLKKGESVVTTSGIVGRVAGQEGGYVLLEISPSVRIKVEGTHVARREKEEAAKSAA